MQMTDDVKALGLLAAAVSAVMAEVPNIEKTGDNTFHRYMYSTDADLLRRLQPAMARHGLMMAPGSVEGTHSEVQAKQPWRYDCIVTYRLIHSSGGWLDIQVPGCGNDTIDKAPYKAMTGAFKYALRQLFAVPTGDDPEAPPPPVQSKQHNTPPPRKPAPPEPYRWPSRDRKWFCAQLTDEGLSYDDVAGYCEAMAKAADRPPCRPSGMSRAMLERLLEKLLEKLQGDARAGLDEWLTARNAPPAAEPEHTPIDAAGYVQLDAPPADDDSPF